MKVYELEERDGVMYAEQPRVHFRRKDTAFRAERSRGSSACRFNRAAFAQGKKSLSVIRRCICVLPRAYKGGCALKKLIYAR